MKVKEMAREMGGALVISIWSVIIGSLVAWWAFGMYGAWKAGGDDWQSALWMTIGYCVFVVVMMIFCGAFPLIRKGPVGPPTDYPGGFSGGI